MKTIGKVAGVFLETIQNTFGNLRQRLANSGLVSLGDIQERLLIRMDVCAL